MPELIEIWRTVRRRRRPWLLVPLLLATSLAGCVRVLPPPSVAPVGPRCTMRPPPLLSAPRPTIPSHSWPPEASVCWTSAEDTAAELEVALLAEWAADVYAICGAPTPADPASVSGRDQDGAPAGGQATSVPSGTTTTVQRPP